MLKKIEGIVLSETLFKETSKIINVFTANGIKGLICKGAMNIKSKNRVTSMKLVLGNFDIYEKEDKLSTLADSDVINYFPHIRNDITLISYASYLGDLVFQVLKQNLTKEEVKNIYNIFKNTLLKIEDGLDPMVMTNILEVKLLDYLGVGLNLTNCTICGNKKDIVTLSSERGGLICKNCYHGERIIPLSIIKVINMYYLVEIKSISKLSLKNDIIHEINNFLNNYYDDYTGLYLKSKSFLKTIAKL